MYSCHFLLLHSMKITIKMGNCTSVSSKYVLVDRVRQQKLLLLVETLIFNIFLLNFQKWHKVQYQHCVISQNKNWGSQTSVTALSFMVVQKSSERREVVTVFLSFYVLLLVENTEDFISRGDQQICNRSEAFSMLGW